VAHRFWWKAGARNPVPIRSPQVSRLPGLLRLREGPGIPADPERIKVIRREKDGTKAVAVLNLEEVMARRRTSV